MKRYESVLKEKVIKLKDYKTNKIIQFTGNEYPSYFEFVTSVLNYEDPDLELKNYKKLNKKIKFYITHRDKATGTLNIGIKGKMIDIADFVTRFKRENKITYDEFISYDWNNDEVLENLII